MTDHGDPIEELLRRTARVRDEDLVGLAAAPAAEALFHGVVSTPYAGADARVRRSGPEGGRRPGRGRRRIPRVVLAAALVLAVGLSGPAFGIDRYIESWISTWRDPDPPVPASPDVIIATGVAGVRWTIVATETDRGLCLFLRYRYEGDDIGTGGCGLGTDIHGYPSASPLGYGADGDRLHWVGGSNGGGFSAGLTRRVVDGVAAEGVASVELVLADGRRVEANLVERPEGIDLPLNVWWAVLPPEVAGVDLGAPGDLIPVHAFIARDRTGAILEQRIVDRPNG